MKEMREKQKLQAQHSTSPTLNHEQPASAANRQFAGAAKPPALQPIATVKP